MHSPAEIEAAIACLKDGGVIAMPTDTLYALAAAACDAHAVRRVYEIKVREAGKPLPLFVSGSSMAREIGEFDSRALALAERFWPGALTLVVKTQPSFISEALAGGDTVALRQPDSDIARAVVEAVGGPVTATSANVSGGADPVTADDVRTQLDGRIDMVLDAGPCPGGRPSTIVDCTAPELRILRNGPISEDEIKAVVGALSAARE
jgi:L-threonylcarbamoyladenylate synthase